MIGLDGKLRARISAKVLYKKVMPDQESRHNFGDPAQVPRPNRFGQIRLGDTTADLPEFTAVFGDDGQPALKLPSLLDHPGFQAVVNQQAADSKFQVKADEEAEEEPNAPEKVLKSLAEIRASYEKEEKSTKAETKKCASCSFVLPVEAKFCMECGEKQLVRFCISCGAEYGNEHKFCAICGQKR